MDVEEQAGRRPGGIAVQHRLGRTEGPGGEAVDGQQAGNALQKSGIVIDHDYDCRLCRHISCLAQIRSVALRVTFRLNGSRGYCPWDQYRLKSPIDRIDERSILFAEHAQTLG